MKTIIIIPCHNRYKKLKECLEALNKFKPDGKVELFLVDDNCKDYSTEITRHIWNGKLTILKDDDDLFWSKSIKLGEQYAKKKDPDYIIWLNEDTVLTKKIDLPTDYISVGTITLKDGTPYRGGLKRDRISPIKFHKMAGIEGEEADTFNGNCVIIPRVIYTQITIEEYSHAMGDIDYGTKAKKLGFKIKTTAPIGTTSKRKSNWKELDTIYKRFMACNTPKGLPLKDWIKFSLEQGGILAIPFSIYSYRYILFKKGK